ncbi:MAG: hypothetical protein NZM31_11475, partial [Gemmatales bacterium]|nr:hypothetical protein [Gemmatales bacterium]MDW8387617.1 hypothetical protein [Gemmatales bacterium]
EWRKRACKQNGTFWANANFRTTFAKIILRAGLEPWPRLWYSLRASAESDLAQAFPLATVTKWLGNTPSVALKHYVDPTDEAFRRALEWKPEAAAGAAGAQKATQQMQETGGFGRHVNLGNFPQVLESPGLAASDLTLPVDGMEARGFEPLTF